MGFKFDASGLFKGLVEAELRSRAALGLYADTVAKKMENQAKNSYPWTDRTYQASRRLKGDWQWNGNVARVTLSHGVDYGIWLEFANEKRFAVLKPTIDIMAPQAIRGLKNLMK